MCDVFEKDNAIEVLKGKTILFLGDSIVRNMYKDLIWLTHNGEFIPSKYMCQAPQKSYEDKLIYYTPEITGKNRASHHFECETPVSKRRYLFQNCVT